MSGISEREKTAKIQGDTNFRGEVGEEGEEPLRGNEGEVRTLTLKGMLPQYLSDFKVQLSAFKAPLLDFKAPLLASFKASSLADSKTSPLANLFKVPLREYKGLSLENEKGHSLGRLPNVLWLAVYSYLDIRSLVTLITSCKKLGQIANAKDVRERLYLAQTNQENQKNNPMKKEFLNADERRPLFSQWLLPAAGHFVQINHQHAPRGGNSAPIYTALKGL